MKYRLLRYFLNDGSLSDDDIKEVENELRQDPKWYRLHEEAPTEGHPVEWNTDAQYEKLKKDLGMTQPARRRREKPPAPRSRKDVRQRTSRFFPVLVQIGALAVVLMSVVTALWIWSPDGPGEETGREYAADRGKRIHIALDDGTSVVLNAESRISIPADFGLPNRTVHLEGEAFFDVVHDEDRPFTIDAGGAVVQVLGTAFGVRSYSSEDEVRVAVREGRVAFRRADGSIDSGTEVLASEVGSLLASGEIQLRRNVDVVQHLGWTEGQLVFIDSPLDEVARDLERWYDIQIEFENDHIKRLPLTATFEGQAVFHVIDVIARTMNLEYDIDGRRVFISASSP